MNDSNEDDVITHIITVWNKATYSRMKVTVTTNIGTKYKFKKKQTLEIGDHFDIPFHGYSSKFKISVEDKALNTEFYEGEVFKDSQYGIYDPDYSEWEWTKPGSPIIKHII